IGQKTQIKFDAVSDQTYEGAVESIAQTGTSSNNVTTYDVVVSVSNPTNIKVGMNANVTILIDSKDDALTVPTDALVDKDGSKYVMVASSTSDSSSNTTNISTTAKSGTASRASGTYSGGGQLVKVTTGLKNENFVEILDGLTEGEKVLVTLPKTTTSTSTTNKNSLGGSSFSGGTGGYSGGGRSN
ncbi:MAG TPA: HlyD family efflux transporter periplasmic adaptor subunit, partial [Clostridium sp.]